MIARRPQDRAVQSGEDLGRSYSHRHGGRGVSKTVAALIPRDIATPKPEVVGF